ncbi:MAG: hypothetical protein Q4C50_03285 [Eubacteriales bacterium]|nr:hypothetical protein [Eubacteriales bacterium]
MSKYWTWWRVVRRHPLQTVIWIIILGKLFGRIHFPFAGAFFSCLMWIAAIAAAVAAQMVYYGLKDKNKSYKFIESQEERTRERRREKIGSVLSGVNLKRQSSEADSESLKKASYEWFDDVASKKGTPEEAPSAENVQVEASAAENVPEEASPAENVAPTEDAQTGSLTEEK